MTREEWELRCARRFQDVGGLEAGEAAAFAKNCAETQIEDVGDDVSEWENPEDAADTDISYWEE